MQDSYLIEFATKGKELTIKKSEVQTIGDIKKIICQNSDLEIDNIRLMVNKKTINDPDSTLITDLSVKNITTIKAIKNKAKKKEVEEQGATIKLEQPQVKAELQVPFVEQRNEQEQIRQARNQAMSEQSRSFIQMTEMMNRVMSGSLSNFNRLNMMEMPSIPTSNTNQTSQLPSRTPEFEEPDQQKEKIDPHSEPEEEQSSIPFCQQLAEEVKAQELKLIEKKWERAGQLARMTWGRQDWADRYIQLMRGKVIRTPIWQKLELTLIRIILTYWMKSKPLKKYKEVVLTEYGFLQFVLKKATKQYSALRMVHENRKKIFYEIAAVELFYYQKIEPNEQEDQNYLNSLKEMTDQSVVDRVERIIKDRIEATRIVEIAQNDLETAIDIAILGENVAHQKHLLQINKDQVLALQKIAEWQQQPFLFRWLMADENYLLHQRLFVDNSFLKVFILSMTHLCKLLAKLLIKHRKYIWKIIEKRPPKLYVERPQF